MAVGPVAKRCGSIKRSLMLRLAWPNFMVNIAEGCPGWDARDVTARLWSTSVRSNSPPAGHYVLIIEAGIFCLRCGFTTEGVRT